jgi:hypothetical protein
MASGPATGTALSTSSATAAAAVEAAVVDGLGVHPSRIDIEPPSPGEPFSPGEARPLSPPSNGRCWPRRIAIVRPGRERRVATLERDGHDSAQGRELLEVFKATLQAYGRAPPTHPRTDRAPEPARAIRP